MGPLFEDDAKCEGCQKFGKPHLTYNVVNKQRLCEQCAQEKQVKPRGDFFCQKHALCKARDFCMTHDTCVCRECLFASHTPPCETVDIDDVVKARTDQLCDLMTNANEKEHELKEYDAKVAERVIQIDNQLSSIEDEIIAAVNEETKEVDNEREEEAVAINRDAEDKIKEIIEQRNEILKQNHICAEEKLRKIQEKEQKLLRELNEVRAIFHERTNEMKSHLRELSATLSRAKNLVDEVKLLNDFQLVERALIKSVKTRVSIDIADKIVHVANQVSFTREDGRAIGRIDAPVEQWEQETELETGIGACNYVMGPTSKDEVVIKNTKDGSVHVTNLNNMTVRSVIEGKIPFHIYSCASLADGRIVCGTRDGQIVIYNQSWNHIRAIDMMTPDTRYRNETQCVSVDVDDNGMILAAVYGDKNIKLYNPDNGRHSRSISCHNRAIRELHALASGEIVVRTKCGEGTDICVLDYSGSVSKLSHFHDQDVLSIAIDRSRDAIYLLVFDHELEDFAVNVVSSHGVATADVPLSLEESALAEIAFLPQSGKIVIQHGENLLVYNKTNYGLDELLGNIT